MTAKPLAIVPTYLRKVQDIQMTETCLKSLRETASDQCDVVVVDDGSPERDLVNGLSTLCEKYDAELVDKAGRNEGFSRTVNVGLRRAMVEGRDAILINNDIEFGLTRDWLRLMVQQQGEADRLASVVGALLIYPNGLIQHAGIHFSLLSREFDHRYRFGPGNLPEAQVATICPVTGALMFIRHDCLEEVGLFDETFRMGWEDVDYNVRVWQSGRDCVFQPGVRAIHHESATRGQGRADKKIEKWTHESWMRFCAKWGDQSFAEFVPMLTVQ